MRQARQAGARLRSGDQFDGAGVDRVLHQGVVGVRDGGDLLALFCGDDRPRLDGVGST